MTDDRRRDEEAATPAAADAPPHSGLPAIEDTDVQELRPV